GGAVGAPMRRRTGRSLPDPCLAAPNRSGDGAPAPVHGRLGSRPREASLARRPAGAAEQLRLPAIAVAQPFLHPAAGPGGRLALGEQARELAPVLDLLEQEDLVVAAGPGRNAPARGDRDHARATRLRIEDRAQRRDVRRELA